MTGVTPGEAATALNDAQAARNATWKAVSPPRPARLAAFFVSYVVATTFMWWCFAGGTAAGWLAGFAIVAVFVGTLATLERRNPKARPQQVTAPFKEHVADMLDPKFIALIMLSVLPGLWIVENQPQLWVIALIVLSEALLSIPLVAMSRREIQSKPA